MGGGAHDLVVEQASQPPYALGKEGRELAVACSACLRSHLAQLGSFRIESKLSDRDYVTQQLRQSAAPEDQKPVQQRLGYDVGAVNRHWGAFDNTALGLERRFLKLDLVFPFLYGAALSASSLRAWATLGRPFRPWWLMAPVAVTVLADWTENLVQLGQPRHYTEGGEAGLQPGWIRIPSPATIL